MIPITDLWISDDPTAWENALKRYWSFVQERNRALEESLDNLDLQRVRQMNSKEWYDFLKDEYFRWKYTAPNRYATTTAQLKRYVDGTGFDELDSIRKRLLTLDTADIRSGLSTACSIRGLGTAGASGLLSLMYPQSFGTVDQFIVKALREVNGLPETTNLERMKAEGLSISDGVVLISILRRKAEDNNRALRSDTWSPRKIDQVLWTYGR